MKPVTAALALNTTVPLALPDESGAMSEIFEPVRFETLADLFALYDAELAKVDRVVESMRDAADVLEYFIEGSVDRSNQYAVKAATLFDRSKAKAAMDAAYWSRALALTDILDSMPQARRDEWHKLCSDHEAPSFDPHTVRATLADLMAQRSTFFAERVDGVFRSLSGRHVTNSPKGFGRRMIISYVCQGGDADLSRSGYITDLRCVVARFMGRGEPERWSTSRTIEHAYREHRGQWLTLDGGALRLRVYKNGNAHIEVHAEIAWRLNAVLASLYPNAIPEKNRRKTAGGRLPKGFELYGRPLPFPVLNMLAHGHPSRDLLSWKLDYGADKSEGFDEARDILVALGGVQQRDPTSFLFDYEAASIIRDVIASGVVPDERAHQFYPTPEPLARAVVAAADIRPEHSTLEPSAGRGAIADLVEGVQCVEVAGLHCDILEAKGHDVVRADFLNWTPGRRFDRVVMNPPFAGGRWRAHLEHVAELCAAGARIVAVLPAGAADRDVLPGWSCTWGEPVPFPGTSISVVVMTADRCEP